MTRTLRPLSTTLAAAGVLVTALVAACGSHGGGGAFGVAGDDTGGQDGSAGSGGSSSGGGGDDGSGLALGAGSSGGGSSTGGGTGTGCDPSCAAAGGTCSGSTCTLAENPGNVSPATQTLLKAGGSGDPSFAWLYPYDKTVFPRGLLSPTLQFGGGASDAEYVHITSKTLDYTGYFAGGAAGKVSLSLSQKAWVAVTAFVGSGDAASVQVTKISGSSVAGPIRETWPIAQGSLRGTVYYETYGSTIAGGTEGVGIMRIQPGATQPTALKAGCGNVCHAASADGSTLVAATTIATSAAYNVANGVADSGAGASGIVTLTTANSTIFTYAGLYPDGSFAMSATNFRDSTNTASRLVSTATGASIAAAGWDSTITLGGTPAFSPDGTQIAFVHEDTSAHTIAKMDVVGSTKTFSGLVDLATDSSGGYVGWPAFTPDGKSVLYQSGTSQTFETDCQNTGDLYVVDVASHTVHRLDTLDGYTGSGSASYLPASDPGLTFAPTVLAEAVGGYFWAVFTTHRSYGSMLASKANSNGLQIGICFNPDGDEANGKLWVAAIDIGAPAGTDPSHPAFYLDGQELEADNLRGYWVLPACSALGVTCQSGDDCCSGYCRMVDGHTVTTCVTQPQGCSNEYEKCSTSADCCTAGDVCINSRCATPAAPQ